MPDFASLLNGIVGRGPGAQEPADQFDDWLADPIYHEDLRLDQAWMVAQLETAWGIGALQTPTPSALALPRDGGRPLRALTLPLSLRLAAHATIEDAAPRLTNRLISDKVIGFGYHSGSVPRFDAPGDRASLIEEAARELIYGGIGDAITVIDVSGFLANATVDRLSSELRSADVLDEQVRFIGSILDMGKPGMPSIDDAFAFLYNVYLAPVDRAIAKSKVNFFRYRDEYFFVEELGTSAVETALSAIGLVGAQKSREIDFNGTLYSLQEQVEGLSHEEREDGPLQQLIGTIGDIEVWAAFDPACSSDCFELYFSVNPAATTRWFFDTCRSGAVLDAVKAVPNLRSFHRRRVPLAWRRPPFDAVSPETATLLNELRQNRDALSAALASAVDNHAEWQAVWAATLLSDVGALDGPDLDVLRTAMVGSDVYAAEAARLALARSSTLPADEIWPGLDNGQDGQVRRSRAMTAYFLANRGAGAAFEGARSEIGLSDPALLRFLYRI